MNSRFPKPMWVKAVLLLAFTLTAGCAKAEGVQSTSNNEPKVPVQTFEVVQAFPHDKGAFTQGLLFDDGHLYESTGLRGHSTVRHVELETGELLNAVRLSDKLYGEGLTAFGDDLILLTWKAGRGFVLNKTDLSRKAIFKYEGDGWGLTSSSEYLYMSDGTSDIRVLDPQTLKEHSRFEVTELGVPVDKLNELEWVNGAIYANIWKTDKIAKIDPATGEITTWIDLSGLFETRDPKFQGEDVLNGIAYDDVEDRLFVTGKLWPKIFEIKLVDQPKH